MHLILKIVLYKWHVRLLRKQNTHYGNRKQLRNHVSCWILGILVDLQSLEIIFSKEFCYDFILFREACRTSLEEQFLNKLVPGLNDEKQILEETEMYKRRVDFLSKVFDEAEASNNQQEVKETSLYTYPKMILFYFYISHYKNYMIILIN